jgi:hypothetical protein
MNSVNNMSEAAFLPLDTETGGIGPDVDLLTAHFAVCDAQWNVMDELDLAVKPNEKDETGSTLYKVTAGALQVNKINLIEHDKVAISYSEAGARLRDFLWRMSENGKIKLQPMGKNVAFDVKKITDTILGKKTWNQFVSYRCYDLTPLITYLKRKGKLALDAPESLEGLAKHFGYSFTAHTAKGDNYAGIEVIKHLERL